MMPRTLFRYVSAEMLRTLCVALGWLMMVGTLVIFLRLRFTEAGRLLGLRECLAGLIVVVPYLFGFLLPAAMLATVISTFGRLSADNELLAMRASGLSPRTVATAPLALGLLASLMGLWLNVEGFAYAAVRLVEVEANFDYDEDTLTRAGNSFKVQEGEGKMIFTFMRAPDGKSTRVRVSRINPRGESFQFEAARFSCRIERRKNAKGQPRRFVDFYLEEVELIDPERPWAKAEFEKMELLNLEMPGAITRTIIGVGSAMRSSLPENLREIRKLNSRIRKRANKYEDKLARARALLVTTGIGGGETRRCTDLVSILYKFPRDLRRISLERDTLVGEVSRKIAFSFSPLLFALVGMGLGAMARKSSKLIGLSLGVLVAALYYGTWVAGKALMQQELLPPALAPWLPNILCLIAGLWLLSRQNRTLS
jgi:lipopolysaccharide export LptBFGC system permease protein LptF